MFKDFIEKDKLIHKKHEDANTSLFCHPFLFTKRIVIFILIFVSIFTLTGCKKKKESIDYQAVINIPTLIEVLIDDVPDRLEKFVKIKDYEAVVKVSVDTKDVIWEYTGDYTISITVDYEDGAFKTFKSILRLSTDETYGRPRIVGVRNRLIDINTTPLDLMKGVAFTDTGEVVESGLNGEVDYDVEGIYPIEYYAVDDDNNHTYTTAYIIVGDISNDYLESIKILYNMTTEEANQLYNYSILYTLALENNYYDSKTILANTGFFVTPELYELLLQRELRPDERRAIQTAQDVFKRNTVRLFKEELDWTFDSKEKEYLDHAYDLLNDYFANSDHILNPTNSFSMASLAIKKEGVFTDFDKEAINFYRRIHSIYFDASVLEVAENTDFELDANMLTHNVGLFPKQQLNMNDLMIDILLNEKKINDDSYERYFVEYAFSDYFEKHDITNYRMGEILSIHDEVVSIYQNRLHFAPHQEYLFLSEEMYEEYSNTILSPSMIESFQHYQELFYHFTNNQVMSFLDIYSSKLPESDKTGTLETFEMLWEKGYLTTQSTRDNIRNYDFNFDELNLMNKYFHYFEYMMNTEFSMDDKFYTVDHFTALNILDLPDYISDNITYLDQEFNEEEALYRYDHYILRSDIKQLYGVYISDSDLEVMDTLIFYLIDNGVSLITIKTYLQLNDFSVIQGEIPLTEAQFNNQFSRYLKLSKRLVKSRFQYVKKYALPLCDDTCKDDLENINRLLDTPPFLISREFYTNYNRYLSNGVERHLENQPVYNYLTSHRDRIGEFNDFYANTSGFDRRIYNYRSGVVLHGKDYDYDKHLRNLYKYTSYLQINGVMYASPATILESLEADANIYLSPSEEQKNALIYFKNLQENNVLYDDYNVVLNMSILMPELVDTNVIIDMINYIKEVHNNPNEEDFYTEKYADSLAIIDSYEVYLNQANIVEEIYNYFVEYNLLDSLYVVIQVLGENNDNILNFRSNSDFIFREETPLYPWMQELSETERQAFENFAEVAMIIRVEETFSFAQNLKEYYGADFIEEIGQIYFEIAKAGARYTMTIDKIEEALERELTTEEDYLIRWMDQCFYPRCTFMNNVEILYNAGYLEHGFTLQDIVDLTIELKQTEIEDFIFELPEYMEHEDIMTFYRKMLKTRPDVTNAYVSKLLFDKLLVLIDDYYADPQSSVFSFNDLANDYIRTKYDTAGITNGFFVRFYFYDEQYLDYYYKMYHIYNHYPLNIGITMAYSTANPGGSSFSNDLILQLFSAEDLLQYKLDYSTLVLDYLRYDDPVLEFKGKNNMELVIYGLDHTSENFNEEIHQINLNTAKIYTLGYLDGDFTNLERYAELFTVYVEQSFYTDETNGVQILESLGYTLTEEEQTFIEIIPNFYDLSLDIRD